MMRRVALAALAAAIVLSACSGIGTGNKQERLVFEREENDNADIYVMNTDGTELTRLTDDPGWDGTPSWSPDGTQIAFASERFGAPVIMVMNADGSDQRALTDPTSTSLMPVWSPDGSQIAFASTRSYEIQEQGGRQQVDAGFEVWVMNADGSNPQRITGNFNDEGLYPTWSPDGKQLAYMNVSDDVRIMVKDAETDATASDLTQSLEGRHWTPAWSPNGRQIAFMNQLDEAAGIWLIDVKSGETEQLSLPDSGDGEPAWSPDGKQIVFVSDRDGPQGLYIMDATGENVRRLTTDGATYSHPMWWGS